MRLDEAKAVLEKAKRVAETKRSVEAMAKRKAAAARLSRPPRRSYLPADLLRMVFLAGAGKSAGEIAEAVGSTTRERVSTVLSKRGISLMPKKGNEVAVTVVMPREALAKIAGFALTRDTVPEVIASAALTALAGEPTVLANLVDDES